MEGCKWSSGGSVDQWSQVGGFRIRIDLMRIQMRICLIQVYSVKHGCRTSPPAYIGWQAGMIALCPSRLNPPARD
jgi:hypothetical protein